MELLMNTSNVSVGVQPVHAYVRQGYLPAERYTMPLDKEIVIVIDLEYGRFAVGSAEGIYWRRRGW
jgi:hypothetical protein